MDIKGKLLITGVSGLLGNNLAYYFKDKYAVLGLYNSHPVNIEGIYTEKCELSYTDNIKRIISDYSPQIIIHCASLANIDGCDEDREATKRINVSATKDIVEGVMSKDVKLIYISTDAVYSGIEGNFSEDDHNIHPQNYYGVSKYDGELEVLKQENSLILRTNLFGWNIQDKKSLGEWILWELKAKQRISGFMDAYFSTIYTMELARVIHISIMKNLTGVYNCGASDSCSKYEFCLKIADCFGLDKTLITPISIDDSDFKAKRGKNLTLNVGKLQKALDYRLPTIDHSIEAFYRDYKCGLPEEITKNQDVHQERSFDLSYGRHWIGVEDIRSVVSVLRSERITQGPKIEEFEHALAEYCGAKFAVAVNSGTSALHIACVASKVEEGDEVITSPITFVASANCAVYCGARPVFADIDPKTFNIEPKEIEEKITEQTKAVIPVHFAGQSCDLESIQGIVKTKEEGFNSKIFIIEDASHALGSIYKNKRIGSSIYSDMTVMSFHPVKHITTGEGGVIFTNDEGLHEKLTILRSHGITSDPGKFVHRDLAFQFSAGGYEPLVNPWYYEQLDLGYNYRITDIQSALGLSQLRKLEKFRERRREIVNMYNEAFNGTESIQIPFESHDCESNFHLYVLLIDFEKIGISRAQFMNELRERGIRTQVHYIPVHIQPYYRRKFGTNWSDCPNAEEYYLKCLSIPLYPLMSDSDVNKVISEIKSLINGQT